jgi:hypothetical protein
MNTFLAQIILARRNEDAESWMNILFVVVLAVFWVLGGILKAKSKSAQSRQKEQLARKPARRPPALSIRLREQLLKQPHRPASPAERRPYRLRVQEATTKLGELRAAARKFHKRRIALPHVHKSHLHLVTAGKDALSPRQ